MSDGADTRRKLTAAQRKKKALDLRIAGHSYEYIAEACGYAGRSGAYKAVSEALRAIPRPSAQEYAAQQRERAEEVHKAMYAAALEGDDKAVHALARLWLALDRYSGWAPEDMRPNSVAEVKSMLERLIEGDDDTED